MSRNDEIKQSMQRIAYRKRSKKFLTTFVLVCVGIGDFILILAGMFGSSPPTKGTLFASTVLEIVIAMMAIIAALIVIEFWTRCFNVDDEHIEGLGVLHRHMSVKWSEITEIRAQKPIDPASLRNGLRIYVGKRERFTVNMFMELPLFAYLVRKNVPEEKWEAVRLLVVGHAKEFELENDIAHRADAGTENEVVMDDERPRTGASG